MDVVPTLISPHLRLRGTFELDATLIAVAAAPVAGNAAPRLLVAADALGHLHVFDSVGRPLMPPTPISLQDRVAPAQVLGLSFLGSPPSGKQASASPLLLAVAVAHEVGSAQVAEGFALCIYRVQNARVPTPEHRVAIDLIHETNITWPKSKEPDALPLGRDGEGKQLQRSKSKSTATADTAPRLIALESISSVGQGGARGRAAEGSKAALLAVRSDGVLLTLSHVGGVLAGVTTGVDGVQSVRRSGSTMALLTRERLLVVELLRREPPRECTIPESLAAAGGYLTSVAFDVQIPQLLYAASSLGTTLIFNSRARAKRPATEDDGAQSATGEGQRAPGATFECRWLDDLTVEPGTESAEAQMLTAFRGYLVMLSDAALRARNVSSIYASGEPLPAALVHSEPLGITQPKRRARHAPPPAPRTVLAVGSLLLVESAREEGGQSVVKLYASTLPYEPATPPTWPQYVMAAAVLGITAIYQLYKRRGSSKEEEDRGASGRGGRGNRGGRGAAPPRGLPGMDSRAAGAQAHYAAHMSAYGSAAREYSRANPTFEYDSD